MTTRRRERFLAAVLISATALSAARPSLAQVTPAVSGADRRNDAADHFRRGVSLYKDRDFVAALVEFRRAYELVPNYRVLFDIAQSLYQLQRYAEALSAFESYLAQAGTQIAPVRRASVESDIRALRARVGRLDVTTNVDGAEIRVDDQTVGTSPLAAPVLVSVGHRKITVAKPGRVPLEKFVDVAAGDRTAVSFDFPEPASPPPVATNTTTPSNPTTRSETHTPANVEPPPPAPPPPESTAPMWIAWTATGLFAAGTAVTGGLVLKSKSNLSTDLGAYPADPSAIDSDRSRAKTLATASDILLAATAVSLAVALYVTLTHRGSQTESGDVKLGLGLGGIQLRGNY